MLITGEAISLATGEVVLHSTVEASLLIASGELWLIKGEATPLVAGEETLLAALGKETLLVATFFLATREENLLFTGLQEDKSTPTKGDATVVGVTWMTKGLSTSSTTAELILVLISFEGLLLAGVDTLLVMCA